LPADEGHRLLAVEAQQEKPGSMLAFTRECLALRRTHSALRQGSMRIAEAGEQLLIFERSDISSRLRCSFNLSDRPAQFAAAGTTLVSTGDIDDSTLGAYAALIEEIG
jgi:alpha-glucosidase